MKLDIGMYVREDGVIGRIFEQEENMKNKKIYIAKFNEVNDYVDESTVTKASHNIIDLIEVGDYVNGQVVTQIIPNNRKIEPSTMIYTGTNYFVGLYNECIETIVTKEQFETIAYKVV